MWGTFRLIYTTDFFWPAATEIFFCYPPSAGTAGDNVQEEEPSSRRSHREHLSATCSPHRPWQSQCKNGVRGEDKHQPVGWICRGGSFWPGCLQRGARSLGTGWTLQEADGGVSGTGPGGQDISYPGEQAVFERERNPLHRRVTGPKTGKRDQEQILET